MEQWIDILSECPIFKNLSRQEMTKIFGDACYTMEEFEKKAVIYRAGDEARRIGIIAKGCLEMRKYLSTGNVLSMFQRKCGEMIGGGMAFSSHPYYPCDVIAKEKSLVIWIERKVILRIFLENETVARNILRISADRIMMFEKRIELFSFYSIRKKNCVFSAARF